MAKFNTELANKAVTLRLEGHGVEAVRAATGLTGHTQEPLLDWFRYYVVEGGQPMEPTPANVAELRNSGLSWIRIAVRVGTGEPYTWLPESRVRRLYTEATGKAHEGLRTGKGGRWLGGQQELYLEALKRTGTELTPEQVRSVEARTQASAQQRLMAKGVAELRKLAKEAGIKVSSNATPAQLAKRLAELA